MAIFPPVAVGMVAAAPIMEGWPPILRAFVLTLMVVPTAVYIVLPRMLRTYASLVRRRNTQLVHGWRPVGKRVATGDAAKAPWGTMDTPPSRVRLSPTI
jgi:hypothetical protein